MKRALVVTCVAAFCLTSLIGCTQRIGDFTLISTKNVDIGGKYKRLDGRFKGEDANDIFLSIPMGVPNLKTAVDNCIEEGNGELLSNAVLEYTYWSIIIFGEQRYTVTGDVWVKASTSELIRPDEELYELQANASGFTLVSLTDSRRSVHVDYLVSR